MRLMYMVLAGIITTTLACNSTGTNEGNAGASGNTEQKIARPPVQSRLSGEGTQRLMEVTTRYYALKNALVATKAARVDTTAALLGVAADSMQALLQKDSASYTALKPYIDTIVSQTRAIAAIKDETCEKQRIEFDHLSSAMYGLLKAVDIKNAGAYHTYCPMAFNDRGAFWLSEKSEVENPYFGKKMLECGEVTDSL